LTQLDLSGNPVLTELYCEGNILSSLDVSKNSLLTDLECCYNDLTELDIRENPWLSEPKVDNNVVILFYEESEAD